METIMRKVCITLLQESIPRPQWPPGNTREHPAASKQQPIQPQPRHGMTRDDKGQANEVANKLSRRLVAVASPRLRMGDLRDARHGCESMGFSPKIDKHVRIYYDLQNRYKIGISTIWDALQAFWKVKLCQAAFVCVRLDCCFVSCYRVQIFFKLWSAHKSMFFNPLWLKFTEQTKILKEYI